MMIPLSLSSYVVVHLFFTSLATTAATQNLSIAALTPGRVESDWTAVWYPPPPPPPREDAREAENNKKPLLLGNDGDASTGGWRAWRLDSLTPVHPETPGQRTKLVTVVHRRQNQKDLVVSIAQTDSLLRAWTLPYFDEVRSARLAVLGDWSALCAWKAPSSRNDYVYLFGKGQARVFLVRGGGGGGDEVRFVEILTFSVPLEASGCATSPSLQKMFLSADEDKTVHVFDLRESTVPPMVSTTGTTEDDVTGLAVYVSSAVGVDYLLVAATDVVYVHDASSFQLLGGLRVVGGHTLEDLVNIEIQGLSVYQGKLPGYPGGVLAFAIQAAGDRAGFGVSPLEDAMAKLGLGINTAYDPRLRTSNPQQQQPICPACLGNGYCSSAPAVRTTTIQCACFAGWTDKTCKRFICENNCSNHGACVGPNTCECRRGWGGLHCSFVLAQPVAETEPAGGRDGDDPAIWIAPSDRSQSRIITTTKSVEGAGLGVFDLDGRLLQTISAPEPNNVDVIYGFPVAEGRKTDLAFAACRGDDSLCLFEITPNGTLTTIPGGSQPVQVGKKFKVYGSCVYKSRATGTQYLFVNAKSSQYLQFRLSFSATKNALETTLVRSFFAGTGGQVEGCVADEDNGWLFVGEEPRALWRYDAEPSSSSDKGTLVAQVGDGHLRADVEGVTLVQGSSPEKGFIIVSTQGVSAYNVYRRKPPHEYVMTFALTKSRDGAIDAVSNTDGITAVSTNLGDRFPRGLVVVHDDSNEEKNTTSAQASFKLVSLRDVLGADVVKGLKLMDEVDGNWDPRVQV